MRLGIRSVAVVAAAWVGMAGSFAVRAEESEDERIARAMSAAPPPVSRDATIVDVDGTVLREGTNGWTCMPGLMPGDDHPMCNDATWMRLMKAWAERAPFEAERIGISYMLQGDAYVSNSDPFATEPEPGEVWVEEGPHLMVVAPDPTMLQGVSDDPCSGEPYVMWGGTPYEHVMVPTGEQVRCGVRVEEE